MKIKHATFTQALESSLRKVDLLTGVHFVAHHAFRAAGFEWEPRRSGDLKIGVWKRPLRARPKSAQQDAFRKRVVLIPGFGDTPLSWVPVISCLIPVFRKRFDELVVLDFPGFSGFLSRERSFESIDQLGESVADVLDSLRPEMIIGHSLGGYLTGRYAAQCGQGKRPLIKNQSYAGPSEVVFVDASGAFEGEEDMRSFLARFLTAAEEGFHHLRPHVFAREPKLFRLVQHEFGKFIRRDDIGAFVRSVKVEHRLEPILEHVRARTWLIWGENDTLVLTRWMYEWLKRLGPETQAKALVLRDCGHSPHVEAPMQLAALLAKIVSGKDAKFLPKGLQSRWWRETVVPAATEPQAV